MSVSLTPASPPISGGTSTPRQSAANSTGTRPRKKRRFESLRSRRVSSLMVIQAAIVIAYLIHQTIDHRLGRTSTYTGSMLAGCLLLLTLLGVRKRLPLARFGSVATWTQVHLYSGAFCVAVYAMHVPRIIADGWLEGPLSIAFLAVAGSGVYGIIASRTFPKRLTALGREVRFDRFGFDRQQIQDKAEGIIGISDETETSNDADADAQSRVGSSTVLIDFYHERLQRYFSMRPAWNRLAWNRSTNRHRLTQQLQELDRYFDADEREMAGKLSALVRMRDELDLAWTLQLRLRLWIAFHAVITLGLIALTAIHVWAVLAYTR